MNQHICFSVAIAVALAGTAMAQPSQPNPDGGPVKRAAELFEQGRELMGLNQFDAACPKFQQSLALDPAIGTKLNLADCLDKRGTAGDALEAHRLFEEAVAEAQAQRLPQQEAFAREHAAALEGRLVKLTISVADPRPAGLTVTIGGVLAAEATWGRPRFLVPGVIEVEAEAQGHQPFRHRSDGVAGKPVVVEVVLAPTTPIDIPVPATPRKASIVPWLVIGGGGALVLGGTAFGLLARSQWSDAKACRDAGARPIAECNDLGDKAGTKADVATGMFVGGVVVAAVGVVLVFRARRAERAAVVTPVATPGGLGLVVAGEF